VKDQLCGCINVCEFKDIHAGTTDECGCKTIFGKQLSQPNEIAVK
jgi:hypothetical protein